MERKELSGSLPVAPGLTIHLSHKRSCIFFHEAADAY